LAARSGKAREAYGGQLLPAASPPQAQQAGRANARPPPFKTDADYQMFLAALARPEDDAPPLTPPPGGLPADGRKLLNRPQSAVEPAALRRCLRRGCPLGREPWVRRLPGELSPDSTLRPRGRPGKRQKASRPLCRSTATCARTPQVVDCQ